MRTLQAGGCLPTHVHLTGWWLPPDLCVPQWQAIALLGRGSGLVPNPLSKDIKKPYARAPFRLVADLLYVRTLQAGGCLPTHAHLTGWWLPPDSCMPQWQAITLAGRGYWLTPSPLSKDIKKV